MNNGSTNRAPTTAMKTTCTPPLTLVVFRVLASVCGTVLVRRGQHDRRTGGDVRRRADPGKQVLEIGGGRDANLEDVGLLARHRPARLDLGDRLEPLGVVVGL